MMTHDYEDRRKSRQEEQKKGGSSEWIPFASYCTTGQFKKLRDGYKNHCGPTAAVNLIRTLDHRDAPGWEKDRNSGKRRIRDQEEHSPDPLFLLCAGIGHDTHIYWNREILGRFGGTSNFLTGIFLRKCLRSVGREKDCVIRFHPWITPDAVADALDSGCIVYLQVYRHPKYKNHHMLCYAYRQEVEGGERMFLLADGWTSGPVWTDEKGLGKGHYLTVSSSRNSS